MGLAPVHFPLWHVSLCVHLLASSQPVPSALLGFEQLPVFESQVPTVWHWSLALHTTGLAPVHTPLWQVSVWVHLSPSSQAPVFTGFEQTPVALSQLPAR
jgi:hypothetical protein